MFTKKFVADLLERVIATAAEALLGTLTVTSLDWDHKLQITAVAALATVLKALASTRVGAPNTAAALPESTDTERGQSYLGLIVVVLLVLIILLATGRL